LRKEQDFSPRFRVVSPPMIPQEHKKRLP